MSESNTASDALQRIRTRTAVVMETMPPAERAMLAPGEIVTMVCAAEIIENLHAVGAAIFGEMHKLVQLAAVARQQADDASGKPRIVLPRA